MTIVTLNLLAGAYRGGRKNLKALLSHSIADGAEKTLCGKISFEHLVDTYGMDEGGLDAPPTCPVCLRRDPRFASRPHGSASKAAPASRKMR